MGGCFAGTGFTTVITTTSMGGTAPTAVSTNGTTATSMAVSGSSVSGTTTYNHRNNYGSGTPLGLNHNKGTMMESNSVSAPSVIADALSGGTGSSLTSKRTAASENSGVTATGAAAVDNSMSGVGNCVPPTNNSVICNTSSASNNFNVISVSSASVGGMADLNETKGGKSLYSINYLYCGEEWIDSERHSQRCVRC